MRTAFEVQVVAVEQSFLAFGSRLAGNAFVVAIPAAIVVGLLLRSSAPPLELLVAGGFSLALLYPFFLLFTLLLFGRTEYVWKRVDDDSLEFERYECVGSFRLLQGRARFTRSALPLRVLGAPGRWTLASGSGSRLWLRRQETVAALASKIADEFEVADRAIFDEPFAAVFDKPKSF
ncbi:MAG: hypothetical protein AAF645_04600 [Myxococcota bacterium]